MSYQNAKIVMPDLGRQPSKLRPCELMNGMTGRVLDGLRGPGECAVFFPDGSQRSYEFIPRSWIVFT